MGEGFAPCAVARRDALISEQKCAKDQGGGTITRLPMARCAAQHRRDGVAALQQPAYPIAELPKSRRLKVVLAWLAPDSITDKNRNTLLAHG